MSENMKKYSINDILIDCILMLKITCFFLQF